MSKRKDMLYIYPIHVSDRDQRNTFKWNILRIKNNMKVSLVGDPELKEWTFYLLSWFIWDSKENITYQFWRKT